MTSTKKKKVVINKVKNSDNVNVAPCKIYRYRITFADKSARDLISPPYAFADDRDAMRWLGQTAERLLDDVQARYAVITCYSFAECDDKGVITFSGDTLVGTLTREDVISALALKLEGFKNA